MQQIALFAKQGHLASTRLFVKYAALACFSQVSHLQDVMCV